MGENKLQIKVNSNNLYLAFKDKQDRLSRKVYRLEFLTNLSHKLKVNNTPETFFAFLQELNMELDVTANRLDKALAFTKSNVELEQDENSFAKLGAKVVHRIVSGQFQTDDYDILSQIGLQDDQAHKYPGGKTAKVRVVRGSALLAASLAGVEDAIQAKLLKRYDFPAGILGMQSLKVQRHIDRFC